MSKTDPAVQAAKQEPNVDLAQIVPGTYARLSAADQAIVDSIIVSEAFDAASRASASPADANDAEKAMLALTTVVSEGKRTAGDSMTSFLGEIVLEVDRERYAAMPELIETVRQIHQKERTPAEGMSGYTRLVNDMINVDGNQFEVQRDLPEIILPESPALKR